MNWVINTFLGCQLFVALFIALHDWIPLGKLNNLAGIQAVDSKRRLLVVTVISSLPYAIGFVASVYYVASGFPIAFYGMLRTWWVPYLLIGDPVRAARNQQRFAHTHAFLPTRNGIRPDTLHVCFHAVLVSC
jgi:hypothetical protein